MIQEADPPLATLTDVVAETPQEGRLREEDNRRQEGDLPLGAYPDRDRPLKSTVTPGRPHPVDTDCKVV